MQWEPLLSISSWLAGWFYVDKGIRLKTMVRTQGISESSASWHRAPVCWNAHTRCAHQTLALPGQQIFLRDSRQPAFCIFEVFGFLTNGPVL